MPPLGGDTEAAAAAADVDAAAAAAMRCCCCACATAAAATSGSGSTLVEPNLVGILPAMCLCSRCTCLRTVLFLVNVRGQ